MNVDYSSAISLILIVDYISVIYIYIYLIYNEIYVCKYQN